MDKLWYFLSLLFEVFGVLALLPSVKRLVAGGDVLPAQVLVGLVSLLLAGQCIRKAQSCSAEPNPSCIRIMFRVLAALLGLCSLILLITPSATRSIVAWLGLASAVGVFFFMAITGRSLRHD